MGYQTTFYHPLTEHAPLVWPTCIIRPNLIEKKGGKKNNTHVLNYEIKKAEINEQLDLFTKKKEASKGCLTASGIFPVEISSICILNLLVIILQDWLIFCMAWSQLATSQTDLCHLLRFPLTFLFSAVSFSILIFYRSLSLDIQRQTAC